MLTKTNSLIGCRRQFIKHFIQVGSLICMGCMNLLAFTDSSKEKKEVKQKQKFQEYAGMTFEEVFTFSYQGYVALMKALAKDIGKAKLLDMLKRAGASAAQEFWKQNAQAFPRRDLKSFIAPAKNSKLMKNALTYKFVEETDNVVEVKVTECLWATTYQKLKATDIGYVSNCFPDFAAARGFNPKIKLIRTKTLMQGHDCCNHRYIMQK